MAIRRTDGLGLGILITSILSLSYSTTHTVAYQRPVHCAVICLAVCAGLVPRACRALPNSSFTNRTTQSSYALLPRSGSHYVDDKNDHDRDTAQVRESRIPSVLLVAAIVALSLRIETYRRIANAPECTISPVEVWLPLLLAVYDALRFQKCGTPDDDDEDIDASIYESIIATWRTRWLRSRARYVLPVACLCLGCHLLLRSWQGLNSTIICPIVTGEQTSVPAAQIAGLLLDFLLLIIAWEVSPRDGTSRLPQTTIRFWSHAMAGTAVVWTAIAVVVYSSLPRHRYFVLLWDVQPVPFLFSFSLQALQFSVLFLAAMHSVLAFGLLDMSIRIVTTVVLSIALPFLWTSTNPFPPFPKPLPTWAVALLFVGWCCCQKIRSSLDSSESVSRIPAKLLLIVGILALIPIWTKHTDVHYHPIDILIYEADLQHKAYTNGSMQEGTLRDAVRHYEQRYLRSPPPGFDVWFEFATNKKAKIIDEYDQIYEDLQPFWSIAPEDLREQTWRLASNPLNEVGGITICNGTAKIHDNVIPTHRWMLEGVEALINSFAAFLPDMDLVFNLNDESRIAVPYDDVQRMQRMQRSDTSRFTEQDQSWSTNRTAGWKAKDLEPWPRELESLSFKPSFRDWGVAGCPPKSAARRDHSLIGAKASLCVQCAAPHSLGQFVSNWSLAADMCHQPDMAHLHGFHMSPAAFLPSHELMPIFSQSKPHGFNDILYPSAWNYMDKVKYDPTYEEQGEPGQDSYRAAYPDLPFNMKNNTLFWRGATSEGVSGGGGQWRGMVRQRLVHLANNATYHPHDAAMILLPHPKQETKWQYTRIPGNVVRTLGLQTDIRIVQNIARCGGLGLFDCTDQEREFQPSSVTPSDFQSHWAYKYLFDLDGAGFSGRFLPFLQSRSLPFKSALFREWYDSRLTAWKHFVPIDMRLHGFWSTLVYFAGVDGVLPDGRRAKSVAHEKQAERIASAGREWANKVLRKEDMEVYFFRLLLEWGRLTDDNRERMGFVLPGS